MKLERIYGKKKAIGYWADNAFHGFVVMDVLHGIDEYLVTCETMNGKRIRYAKNKVFETMNGKFYIRKFNRRIYLTEILRT